MTLPAALRFAANKFLPKTVHDFIDNQKWLSSVRKHRSHLHYDIAPQFTKHLEWCRSQQSRSVELNPELSCALAKFHRDGFACFRTPQTEGLATQILDDIRNLELSDAIWSDEGTNPGTRRFARDSFQSFPAFEEMWKGDLGRFIEGIYGTHFQIWRKYLFKTEHHPDESVASTLWHWDGGCGTRLNVIIGLSEMDPDNGATRFLPWSATKKIMAGERKAMAQLMQEIDRRQLTDVALRTMKCRWIEGLISQKFSHRVEQFTVPRGTILVFNNNVCHCGGHVRIPGRFRYVSIAHTFPSHEPAPFATYRKDGIHHPSDPQDSAPLIAVSAP